MKLDDQAELVIPDRVSRGARLLDRVRPGWWREIAAERLAMESCDRCVLGQLYGHYWEGCKEVWKSLPRALFASSEFGFTLPDDDQNRWIERNGVDDAAALFAPLAAAWRAEIARRLESVTTPESP